jgi:hypothetical protein
VVDHTGKTSVAGVWVAGNAADPRAQVITSAGAGSAAAIAINADLVGEDVRRAMEEIGLGGDHPADPDRGKEPHWDGAASESQDDTRSGGWPALTQPSHRRTR